MACAQAVKEREAAIKNANEKERQAKALKGSLDGEIKVRVLVMSPCLGCGTWPQQRGAKVETVLEPPPPGGGRFHVPHLHLAVFAGLQDA